MSEWSFSQLGEDRDAFGRFLEAHYDRIYRYAYRILGNASEAEDLTQDVCLALPAKLRSYRGDAQVSTWLYRVVSNMALDRLRRAKMQDGHAGTLRDVQADLDHANREGRSRDAWLRAAVRDLGDDLRVTFALLIEQDMTQAEAAKVLDVAPGTVAWRMSEIKKQLAAHAASEAPGVDSHHVEGRSYV